MEFGIPLTPLRLNKWWTPKTEEQGRLFSSAKQDVTCYLSIMREGLRCIKAYARFADFMENEIEFRRMGFRSFGEFLFHCDDILECRTDGYEYYLFVKNEGAEDVQEVAHIQDLVQNQRADENRRGIEVTREYTWLCPSEQLLQIYYDLRLPNSNAQGQQLYNNHGRRNDSSKFNYNYSSLSSSTSGGFCSSDPFSDSKFSKSSSESSLSRNRLIGNLPPLKPLNQAAVDYQRRSNANMATNATTATMGSKPASVKSIPQPASNNPTNKSDENNSTKPAVNNPPSKSDSNNSSKTTAQTGSSSNIISKSLNAPAPTISNAASSFTSAARNNNTQKVGTAKQAPPSLMSIPFRNIYARPTPPPPAPQTTTAATSFPNPHSPVFLIPRMRNTLAPIPAYNVSSSSSSNVNQRPVLKTLHTVSNSLLGQYRAPQKAPELIQRTSLLGNPPPPALRPVSQLVRTVAPAASLYNISKNKEPTVQQQASTTASGVPHLKSVGTPKAESTDAKAVSKGSLDALSSGMAEKSSASSTLVEASVKKTEGKEQEEKKIFGAVKRLPTSLSVSKFQGKIVGADEYGYIFVQQAESTEQEYYKDLKDDIQKFYKSTGRLAEYLMSSNEIQPGLFVIAFLEKSGIFIRGKIDQDRVDDRVNLCYVYDIDDCDFHVVNKKNIFHMHDEFTRRHPQAIQLIQSGTESKMLTPELHRVISTAFQRINQHVEVTNISSPHLNLGAPVASILTGGQSLLEVFKFCGLNVTQDQASLTTEQHEILKKLKAKSHIVGS